MSALGAKADVEGFAKGEITKEEFSQMKKDILS
jgi:uncharacterized membrane protein